MTISRRRVIGAGAGVAAAAWVAPAIISAPAASAASAPPPPPPLNGVISGLVGPCGRTGDPADGIFLIEARPAGGGPVVGSTTSSLAQNAVGAYSLTLPAGTYDLDVTPSPHVAQPTQTDPGIVVAAGLTTSHTIDYQANGC